MPVQCDNTPVQCDNMQVTQAHTLHLLDNKANNVGLLAACVLQLQGMLSPFGELKDCVVIVDKMTQKSKVRCMGSAFRPTLPLCAPALLLALVMWSC